MEDHLPIVFQYPIVSELSASPSKLDDSALGTLLVFNCDKRIRSVWTFYSFYLSKYMVLTLELMEAFSIDENANGTGLVMGEPKWWILSARLPTHDQSGR